MKKLIFSLGFVVAIGLIQLHGQTELFNGGMADGFSSAASEVLTLPITYSDLFGGGNHDGFSFAASAILTTTTTYPDLYRGGTNDGFSFKPSATLTTPTNYNELYHGGSNDGFTKAATDILTLPATYSELYQGNQNDGFSTTPSGLLTLPPTYDELFSGGEQDGFSFGMGVLTFPELFRANIADGFAAAASDILTLLPLFPETFSGGRADGFALNASDDITVVPIFSEMYGGGTADGFALSEPGIILPINLLSFTATPKGNSVLLQFTTAAEWQTDFFTLERSKNTIDTEFLTKINAKAAQGKGVSYHFEDKSPHIGLSYYRLIETDNAGQRTVFDWHPVIIKAEKGDIYLFPNPASEHIQMLSFLEKEVIGNVVILDAKGAIVKQMDNFILAKEESKKIDLSGMTKGLYFLKIRDKGGIEYSFKFGKI